MQIFQVTLGSGATQILPPPPNSLLASNNFISFQQLIIQNNTASDSCRVGDSTVSATKGIKLVAGASLNISLPLAYAATLADFYIFGTQNDVIDIMLME